MARNLRRGALSLVLVSLVALTGCGDDDADSSGSASSSVPGNTAAGNAGSPTAAAPAPTDSVEILATANLQFVPNTLTAKVAELFKGTLVQRGAIPHNIEFKDFAVKGADTMVTKDGESKAFSFTPSKPGSYTYVCTIHPATMKGTLTVS